MSELQPFAKYIESLDRKITGVAVLIRDENENILIVKPTYKDGWLLPGGSVEKYESPYKACIRETIEEVNLQPKIKSLLVVDYAKKEKQGVIYDAIQFIFDGGIITKKDISNIKLPTEELSEYRFITKNELSTFFTEGRSTRVISAIEALENKSCYFLENGTRVA